MDSAAAITLAMICVFGWVVGLCRPRRALWIIIGFVPGEFLLLLFMFWQLFVVAKPTMISGVEVGWTTLLAMIGGFCALLDDPGLRDRMRQASTPKPPTQGGQPSSR